MICHSEIVNVRRKYLFIYCIFVVYPMSTLLKNQPCWDTRQTYDIWKGLNGELIALHSKPLSREEPGCMKEEKHESTLLIWLKLSNKNHETVINIDFDKYDEVRRGLVVEITEVLNWISFQVVMKAQLWQDYWILRSRNLENERRKGARKR